MFSPEFLLTSFIVVLTPGTGVIYTISTGLFQGWRASVAAALGCTFGIVPHLTASILGVSLILHMSAVAFQALKWIGALYLLYLAWMMWRESEALNFDSTLSPKTPWQIASKAFLINILNPKLTIFFFAFLPLFLAPQTTSPVNEMVSLSAVFMLITLIIFVLYGVLASRVRQYVIRSPKLIVGLQRSFAAVFVALSVKLVLTER